MSLLDWIGKRVFGNAGLEHKLTGLDTFGSTGYARGTGISDEALGDIRKSIGDYQTRLDNGEALDPSVRRAYDLAFGRTRDTAVRASNTTRSRLSQQRLSS